VKIFLLFHLDYWTAWI